jgi:hypothetical protein
MGGLVKFSVFPCKFNEWCDYFGKASYKPPIEVCKADECLYVFEVARGRPVYYCFYLSKVHLHTILSDDHSEERCFCYMEFALMLRSCYGVATEALRWLGGERCS